MPKPFANTQGFNGTFLDTYLIAMQAGTLTGDPGLDQMRKISLGQLRAYVRQGFGNMMNFRGAYASALPENPEINDYFYASATFTVNEVTYTQYHFYEYNGTAWFDISGVLSQFCTLAQATSIAQEQINSLALLKSQLEHTLSGNAGKIPASDAVSAAVSGKTDKFVPAEAGNLALLNALGNLSDSGINKAVITLMQAEIAYLRARGRFLSLWDCAAGTPVSFPLTTPYSYVTGDYYIVSNVSSADPVVNYRPDGASYTTGAVSTVVEATAVNVDDTYYYDGTNWLLLNGANVASFASLAGKPYDNAALAEQFEKINGPVAGYDPSYTYSMGDVVKYEDSLHYCIRQTTGTFTPMDWVPYDLYTISTLIDSLQWNKLGVDAVTSVITQGQLTVPSNFAVDMAVTGIRGTRSEYSSSGTYAKGDYVIYMGVLYRALQAVSNEAWDQTHWEAVDLETLRADVDTNADAINAIIKRYDGKTVAFYVACASQVNGFYSLFIDLGAKYNITVESIKRVGSTTELKSNFSLASGSSDIVHLYSSESSYAGTWFSVQLSLVYYQ